MATEEITESGLEDFSLFCPAASLSIATRTARHSPSKTASAQVRAKVDWFAKRTVTPEPAGASKNMVSAHPLARNTLPTNHSKLSEVAARHTTEEPIEHRARNDIRSSSRPLSQHAVTPLDALKPLRALQDELNALKGCVSQRRVLFSPQRASSPIVHTAAASSSPDDLTIDSSLTTDHTLTTDPTLTTDHTLEETAAAATGSVITPLEEYCVQVEPFIDPSLPPSRRLSRRGSLEYDHLEHFDPSSQPVDGTNSPDGVGHDDIASAAGDNDSYCVTVQFNTATSTSSIAPEDAVRMEDTVRGEDTDPTVAEDRQQPCCVDEPCLLPRSPRRSLAAGISHSIPGRLNSPSLRLGSHRKLCQWSSATTLPVPPGDCHCPVCCSCGSSQRRLTSSVSFTLDPAGSVDQRDLFSSWPRHRLCPLKQYSNKPSPQPSRKPSVHFSPALPVKFAGTSPSRSQQPDQSSLITTHLARLPWQQASDDDDTQSLLSQYSHQSVSTGCCDHTHISTNEGVDGSVFKQRMKLLTEWFTDFSDQQRNTLLLRILEQCNCAQMHLLSLQMEPILHQTCPHNCQDLLSWLPSPIVQHILSFLDPESLCRASQVSRSWYSICCDPWLWKSLALNSKWSLSPEGHYKQLVSLVQPDNMIQWKKVFAERYRLRRNWLKGFCTVRTFEGHSQGISCVQFDDTRIVSGSWDKTIKVWNRRTNTAWAALTLAGHSGTVRCLHLHKNRLVSGSSDRTIKVWDLATDRVGWVGAACRATMIGHMHTVRCLQTDDSKVVSGSYDHTVKVWDLMTGQCNNTLRGHTDAVLCLQFDNEKIVSGSKDTTIKVWLLSDDQCHLTLHGHQGAVTCLQFDESRVISGALDRLIKIWSITTGECLRTIDWIRSEGHTGVVRHLQADSWKIVSAADDKTLKVWSVLKGERLLTLQSHTDGVTCLQFNDQVIVSGSYDKSVKLWDFSVC